VGGGPPELPELRRTPIPTKNPNKKTYGRALQRRDREMASAQQGAGAAHGVEQAGATAHVRARDPSRARAESWHAALPHYCRNADSDCVLLVTES
jgi:hypothetical protein